MRTTEPERWQELLDRVASIPADALRKFRQQTFYLEGGRRFNDRDRFCTVEGLNRQLDEFDMRVGLVYYLDGATMGIKRVAFEKTPEEHFK